MQYRSLVMSDITSDFPGLKSYSRRPICVPNGHKHPIGTGDTLLEYKKDKPKNQILFFSAISFTLPERTRQIQCPHSASVLIDSATMCRMVDNCFTINEIANCLWRISTKDKCFVT